MMRGGGADENGRLEPRQSGRKLEQRQCQQPAGFESEQQQARQPEQQPGVPVRAPRASNTPTGQIGLVSTSATALALPVAVQAPSAGLLLASTRPGRSGRSLTERPAGPFFLLSAGCARAPAEQRPQRSCYSMKSYRDLFVRIASAENLYEAWRAARRGKRYRARAARFELCVDANLLRLGAELHNGSYRPGGYRIMFIREPKRRAIAAAPFRDRVVHHAICRVLMPLLSASFIHDSYACLPGKGTHRAVIRHLERMRRYRYRCHLDVRAFFPSVNVDRLLAVVARRVRDERALSLLELILDSGPAIYLQADVRSYLGITTAPHKRCGLPIGNLTSQHLANVFLDGLDHHAKRRCKLQGYQRYMDDMTLFGDDRALLLSAANSCAAFLRVERGLQLKHAPRVTSTRVAVRYLGCQVSRAGIALHPATLEKIGRNAGALRSADPERLRRALASWRGLVWG